MRDKQRTNKQTLKIELLSQWKLEAEFRNLTFDSRRKAIWDKSNKDFPTIGNLRLCLSK